jgi:hypothetical protein
MAMASLPRMSFLSSIAPHSSHLLRRLVFEMLSKLMSCSGISISNLHHPGCICFDEATRCLASITLALTSRTWFHGLESRRVSSCRLRMKSVRGGDFPSQCSILTIAFPLKYNKTCNEIHDIFRSRHSDVDVRFIGLSCTPHSPSTSILHSIPPGATGTRLYTGGVDQAFNNGSLKASDHNH